MHGSRKLPGAACRVKCQVAGENAHPNGACLLRIPHFLRKLAWPQTRLLCKGHENVNKKAVGWL